MTLANVFFVVSKGFGLSSPGSASQVSLRVCAVYDSLEAGASHHHRHPQVEAPCQLPSLLLLGLEVLEGTDGSDGLTSIVESQRTMKRTPKMKLTIIPKKVTPLAELSILEVLLAPRIPPLLILLNKFQTIKNDCYDLVLRTL